MEIMRKRQTCFDYVQYVQNIAVTTSRPDLVVVDSSPPVPTVYLFELTVCFERVGNMEAANAWNMIDIPPWQMTLRRQDMTVRIFHSRLGQEVTLLWKTSQSSP